MQYLKCGIGNGKVKVRKLGNNVIFSLFVISSALEI